MTKRQQAEARQLTEMIKAYRGMALRCVNPDTAAMFNAKARQYLFDLIRLTRYKSAINPVNEAY